MVITIKKIKEFNPRKYGIDNFQNKYPNYENKLSHLLSLEDISYGDKIWLATKVLDKMTLVQWSLECAEMVFENYDSIYSNDDRVRNCLEIVKKYINGEADESAARSAVESAQSARSAAEIDQENLNLSILIALVDNLEEE